MFAADDLLAIGHVVESRAVCTAAGGTHRPLPLNPPLSGSPAEADEPWEAKPRLAWVRINLRQETDETGRPLLKTPLRGYVRLG